MCWGARVAAITLVLAHAASARATEPACFPERTVLVTTRLEDAAGNVIGTLRGGKQVTLVAEGVGPKGSMVAISISDPVPLRAFVKPDALLVFLKEDFPLEVNRTWWMAGTPMRIFAGDARRAEVTGDDAEEGAPKLVWNRAGGSAGRGRLAWPMPDSTGTLLYPPSLPRERRSLVLTLRFPRRERERSSVRGHERGIAALSAMRFAGVRALRQQDRISRSRRCSSRDRPGRTSASGASFARAPLGTRRRAAR